MKGQRCAIGSSDSGSKDREIGKLTKPALPEKVARAWGTRHCADVGEMEA
jgi:hypothetical protein